MTFYGQKSLSMENVGVGLDLDEVLKFPRQPNAGMTLIYRFIRDSQKEGN